MAREWLNIFLKFSGFVFSLKEKITKEDNLIKVIPVAIFLILMEFIFVIFSFPLYLFVSPKKLQEKGFIFPTPFKDIDHIQIYSVRRKISLATLVSAGGLFLSKILFVGVVSFFLLGGNTLLAATQTWDFTTAGNYTYDSAKIEVTGGVAQLKDTGSTVLGNTTNSGFDSAVTGWTYADWGQDGGEANINGSYVSTGGNPGGYVQINVPAEKSDEVGGYYYQAFTTTVANPTVALDFDRFVSAYDSTPNPVTFKFYVFVDTTAVVPTIGTEVYSSTEITSTQSWTSVTNLDVSSKVTTAGTYYLKVAIWIETPGSTGGPYTVGYDNVYLDWSKITTSYASDSPTIQPTTSLNPTFVSSWNSFTETSTLNGGSINYQLSDDDGVNWKYWNGAWTTSTLATHYNSASVINTNISTFPVVTKKIMWKAFLVGTGTQQVILDNVDINYTENSLPVVLNLTGAQRTTSAGLVDVTYNLQDAESDPSSLTAYEYSTDNSTWFTMTAVTGDPAHNGISSLTSSPSGVAHTFVWNASADLGALYDATVYVRLRANDGTGNGSYATSATFAVDTALPVVSSVSASQTASSTNIVVTYNLSDDNTTDLLVEMDVSQDSGATWMVATSTTSGSIGAGQTSGTGKTITWAAGTDFDEQQQSDIRVRVRARDSRYNQGANTASADFALDTLNPATNAQTNLQSQPTAGATSVLVGGSFVEANPSMNMFYTDLNGGGYGTAVVGTSNTNSPSNLAIPVGATLDGNDYVSAVKIVHTDDFGQSYTNENTSLAVALKYVKPYTPLAPTLANPDTAQLDLTINPNLSEANDLEYAINEVSTGNFVQADGTLAGSAVWRTTGDWGTVTVNGLNSPVSQYIFQVKSRNISDTSNAVSSQSAYSATAEITNTVPSIVLGSIAQTTNGTQYTTINYTGSDAQGNINILNTYEYSLDNSAWSTMTEKSSVGSDGVTNLLFASGGTAHDFMWNSGLDASGVEDSTVYIRLKSNDGTSDSTLQTSSAFAIDNVLPVVANVSATQNSGARTVAINYDLTEGNNSTVELDISEDGGSTWTVVDTSVTGEVGSGKTSGSGKTVTWNAGADFDNQYQTDMQVRVRAMDTFGNQGPYTQSANFIVDTKDPVVASVTASQNNGADTFTFAYDLSEDGGSATVGLEVSNDSGSSWTVPVTSASGSVGSGVTVGTGNTITWNGATDYNNNEETDMMVRITATDSYTNTHNASSTIFSLDTYAPRVTSVTAVQTSATNNVVFSYNLAETSTSTVELDISEDGGSTWTVTDASVTGEVGTNISAGTGKTITWAAGTDFDEQAQSDMRVRIRAKDTKEHQGANVESANFALDTLNPTTNVSANLQAQPNAGDTSALISGSFVETNPNTNNFYVALNTSDYGTATASDTNTASPTNQTTGVGATLDGNDYISKVKIVHVDDFGQSYTNENTSPTASYKYVKPYTPAVPTVNNPGVGTVDVVVNKNASEVDGLEYAIYESTQNKYVQTSGTLGASAVWKTIAGWGTVNVNGLTNASYTYVFQVKSRNTSDGSNLSSSQSALSSGASSLNQAPSISISTVAQTTDGTKYVTINYTGTDLESNSANIITTEYSTNNSNWFTMTEKSGVGSDGTTGILFSSGGTAHDFMWDVGTDLANTEDTTVYVRLQANDGTTSGGIDTSSAFTVDTKNPIVSTVSGVQVADSNSVTFTYTLADLSNSTVELDISEDAGVTWAVTDTSVTGAIGAGQTAGTGKTITWNAGADFDAQEQNDLRVQVRALDTFGNQGSYTESSNFTLDTKNPAVSNVSAVQNSGLDTVAITYDLADAHNSTVEIDISEDGGSNWTVADTSLTGAYGAGVTPGTGKTITWNAGADFDEQDQLDMRVRVRATDIFANASGDVQSANFSLDTKAPVIASVSVVQTAGTTDVVFTYDLTDNGSVNIALDISEDSGATWAVTDTNVTGAVGAGVSQGTGKTIIWAAGTDFNEEQQTDMRVRVRGTDTHNNVSSNVQSADFTLDTLNPVTNVTANLQSQPNAGDTTALIGGSFTEVNPDTNNFYVAINGGVYGVAIAGSSNTATPANQATAVDTTLDGSDYISKVKIIHVDDFGQTVTNENTSPSVSLKYVKPYTPAVPTVSNPQNTTVDVVVNKNTSEVAGLQYAIYENTTGKYVQASGALGTSAVWQTIAVWDTVTVTGLASPVAQHNFQTKSRNSSDISNATSSESALSGFGAITNSAPSLSISSVSQSTGGSSYVTVSYTGTDAQNDTNSLNIYEYSRDNSTWNTMTEKSGVGSDGVSGLLFTSTSVNFTFKWDSATDLPGIEDATVYVRLRANDGIVSGSTVVSSAFSVDNAGPTVSNVTASQTPNTNNIVFQYDLADNSTTNLTVALDISEDAGVTWTVTDTSVTGEFGAGQTAGTGKTITWNAGTDFNEQEQSDIRVRIRGTDIYANTGSSAESSNFIIDTKNPVVSSVSAVQTPATNNVVITYNLTDATSAGHTVELDISSDSGVTWLVTDTSVIGSVGAGQTTGTGKTIVWDAGMDFDAQEQSDMRVRVRALDYFANQGDNTFSTDFSVDTKAPTVTNVSAVQSLTLNNVTINYDLADGASTNTVVLDISENGGLTWAVTDTSVIGDVGSGVTTGVNKTITWNAGTDFIGQDQSDLRVRVRATDTFDNTSAYSQSSDFSLDTAAPVGLVSFSKFTGTSTEVTLNWSSGSTDSNFDHYEIWHGASLDDVNNRTGSAVEWDNTDDTALANIATAQTVVTGLSITTNYYAKIWAIDSRGNEVTLSGIDLLEVPTPVVEPATVVTGGGGGPQEIINPDITPPGQPILNQIATPTRNLSLSISGLAEPRSIVELYDNNTLVMTLQSLTDNNGIFEQSIQFTEGAHLLVAMARDTAGNRSVPSNPIVLNIDLTPPVAPTILYPENNGALPNVNTIVTGLAEPNSTVNVEIENKVYVTEANDTGIWVLVVPSDVVEVGNEYNISANAIDQAGNASTDVQVTVTVVLPENLPEGTPAIPIIPGVIIEQPTLPIGEVIIPIVPITLIQPSIIEAVEIANLPLPVVSAAAPVVQNNTFTFSGTALPNSTVLVYINSETALVYKTFSDAKGAWSINHSQDEVTLKPGEHTIFAVSVDEKFKVKTPVSMVKRFVVEKSFWVSLFNYLNWQTTLATIIILIASMGYLYRLRLKREEEQVRI